MQTNDGVDITAWEPMGMFPMEVVDPMAIPAGAAAGHPGMTFYEAGYALTEAFDDHELRDESGKLIDGYLYADLLDVLHDHWSARSAAPCTGPPQETCTQLSCGGWSGASVSSLTSWRRKPRAWSSALGMAARR